MDRLIEERMVPVRRLLADVDPERSAQAVVAAVGEVLQIHVEALRLIARAVDRMTYDRTSATLENVRQQIDEAREAYGETMRRQAAQRQGPSGQMSQPQDAAPGQPSQPQGGAPDQPHDGSPQPAPNPADDHQQPAPAADQPDVDDGQPQPEPEPAAAQQPPDPVPPAAPAAPPDHTEPEPDPSEQPVPGPAVYAPVRPRVPRAAFSPAPARPRPPDPAPRPRQQQQQQQQQGPYRSPRHLPGDVGA